VTLDADPELEAQVERFLITEPELSAKLVDANLLGQLALRSSLPGTRATTILATGAVTYPRTPASVA
jgi:hypothetical protein